MHQGCHACKSSGVLGGVQACSWKWVGVLVDDCAIEGRSFNDVYLEYRCRCALERFCGLPQSMVNQTARNKVKWPKGERVGAEQGEHSRQVGLMYVGELGKTSRWATPVKFGLQRSISSWQVEAAG